MLPFKPKPASLPRAGDLCRLRRKPSVEMGLADRSLSLSLSLSLDTHLRSEAFRKKLGSARRRELAPWFHRTFQVSYVRPVA